MMTDSNLIELTLPNHWASPMINGDTSGLSEDELDELNSFWINEMQGLHCLDVKDDSSFVKYHDAQQYALAGDCSTFVFLPLNNDYAN